MAFELPKLAFAEDALASKGLSKETIEYHYGKHHATYVKTLNELVEGKDNSALDETVMSTEGKAFNQAAQHWNHSFYWECLSPNGGGEPPAEVEEKLKEAFGSVEDFNKQFAAEAAAQFGSGWAWLVENGGKLEIMKTANADLPMKHGAKALLTIDVWEHAYYIDFRNARPKYIENFMTNLVNWEFVAKNLFGEGKLF